MSYGLIVELKKETLLFELLESARTVFCNLLRIRNVPVFIAQEYYEGKTKEVDEWTMLKVGKIFIVWPDGLDSKIEITAFNNITQTGEEVAVAIDIRQRSDEPFVRKVLAAGIAIALAESQNGEIVDDSDHWIISEKEPFDIRIKPDRFFNLLALKKEHETLNKASKEFAERLPVRVS